MYRHIILSGLLVCRSFSPSSDIQSSGCKATETNEVLFSYTMVLITARFFIQYDLLCLQRRVVNSIRLYFTAEVASYIAFVYRISERNTCKNNLIISYKNLYRFLSSIRRILIGVQFNNILWIPKVYLWERERAI